MSKNLKTPISYYGAKQTMLKHILPLIPKHKLYTEAFCGGCAILFAKEPCECEVVNDLNSCLMNFYKVSKTNYSELKMIIQSTPHSRSAHGHARYVLNNPYWFDSIRQAWAIWVASKQSYASILDSTFGYDRTGITAKKIDNAHKLFDDMNFADRLDRVTFECEDGINVIKRYDTPDAFHFIDPPYVGSDCGHYAGTFNEQNLKALLDTLVAVKGKFMLTMYPNEMIQEYAISNSWTIHKIERTISVSQSNRRKQEEWIIYNYNLKSV